MIVFENVPTFNRELEKNVFICLALSMLFESIYLKYVLINNTTYPHVNFVHLLYS